MLKRQGGTRAEYEPTFPHFDKNATVLDKLGFYKKARLIRTEGGAGESLPYLPSNRRQDIPKVDRSRQPFAAGAVVRRTLHDRFRLYGPERGKGE